MSIIGKTVNGITNFSVKASGAVTALATEAITSVGKVVGIEEETCDSIREKGNALGRDMWEFGEEAGDTIEDVTDTIVDQGVKGIKNFIENQKEKRK